MIGFFTCSLHLPRWLNLHAHTTCQHYLIRLDIQDELLLNTIIVCFYQYKYKSPFFATLLLHTTKKRRQLYLTSYLDTIYIYINTSIHFCHQLWTFTNACNWHCIFKYWNTKPTLLLAYWKKYIITC